MDAERTGIDTEECRLTERQKAHLTKLADTAI